MNTSLNAGYQKAGELGWVTQPCNPSAREAGIRGWRVQAQTVYRARPCLRKKQNSKLISDRLESEPMSSLLLYSVSQGRRRMLAKCHAHCLASFQNCQANTFLLIINYPGSGFLLHQQKTNWGTSLVNTNSTEMTKVIRANQEVSRL